MEWRNVFDTISLLGSIASVVALIQVGRVWSRIRRVERTYRQQQCLPLYSKKLQAQLKNLETARTSKNRQNATSELARCEAILESATDLIEKTIRHRVSSARKAIAAARGLNPNDTAFFLDLGGLIAQIAGVQTLIANYLSEQPWRRTNGN